MSEESIKDAEGITIRYRSAVCPDCEKKILAIENSWVKITDEMILRLEDEDKVFPTFEDVGARCKPEIDIIKTTLDDRIGELRDRWEKPEEEKKQLVLITSGGEELKDKDEVLEYIRDNFDEDDIVEWINNEFDSVDIGPYHYLPSDIVMEIEGGYSDIANETFSCDYANDRFCYSSYEDIFERECDDIDAPEDGKEIDIASLLFTVRWKDVENDNQTGE